MKGASLVVEFVGSAYVGKTTVCQAVLERLRSRSQHVGERPSRVRVLLALVSLRNLRMLFHSWRILSRGGLIRKRGWKPYCKWCVDALLERVSRRAPGIHLYDQLSLQRLRFLRRHSTPDEFAEMLGGFGERLPRPDVVVLVQASQETLLKRFLKRNGIDPEKADDSDLDRVRRAKNFFRQQAEHEYDSTMQTVQSVRMRFPEMRILEFQNEDDSMLPTNAGDLAEQLVGLLNHRTQTP